MTLVVSGHNQSLLLLYQEGSCLTGNIIACLNNTTYAPSARKEGRKDRRKEEGTNGGRKEGRRKEGTEEGRKEERNERREGAETLSISPDNRTCIKCIHIYKERERETERAYLFIYLNILIAYM